MVKSWDPTTSAGHSSEDDGRLRYGPPRWAGPTEVRRNTMKLNEILGTEFPIIQGGMANIATGE